MQGPAVVSEAGSVGTNCNDLFTGVIARSASPSESTSMPDTRRPLKKIAEFTYIDTVLALDKTIGWLKQRAEVEPCPDSEYMNSLVGFLSRMRKEASDAVDTKPFHWD